MKMNRAIAQRIAQLRAKVEVEFVTPSVYQGGEE